MKTPLLIGTDLTTLPQQNIDLLKNPYLLAFNQDNVYGRPATPYKWGTNPDWTYNETWPVEYRVVGAKAGILVLVLNPSNKTNETKEAVWSEIPGLSNHSRQVMDVLSGKDLRCMQSYSADISSHDTAVILVGQEC